MTAASPGIVVSAMEDQHYGSREEYLHAVTEAMRVEYEYIVDRGLLLQIDAPDLAMERHTLFADRPLSEFLDWVGLVIDSINRALAGIDRARVRLHVCWGNYEGPHNLDVPLEEILALLYRAACRRARDLHGQRAPRARVPVLREHRFPPGRRSSQASSTRRATTWSTPRSSRTASTRVAEAVGDPRRIIAGTDCGFDTSAGIGDVAASVVWEKLRSLARRRGPGDDALALSLSRSSARACPAPRTRLRRAFRRQDHRHLTAPVRELQILGLLDGRTAAYLRRRLGDRHADHARRAQLGLVRTSALIRTARQIVVDNGRAALGASRRGPRRALPHRRRPPIGSSSSGGTPNARARGRRRWSR